MLNSKIFWPLWFFFLLFGCARQAGTPIHPTSPVNTEVILHTAIPTSPTPLEPNISQDCESGYVISGGDTTPEGLLDAPRTFLYEVSRPDNSLYKVTYIALPPSPSGDKKLFNLDFYAGSILIGDYLEACGEFNPVSNSLTVKNEGDFIKSFPTTKVMIVRHAERASGDVNSNLSFIGLAQAEVLAKLAVDAGVQAIFTTDYCRTAQTGQPAAKALQMKIRAQSSGDPSAGLNSCNPPIDVQVEILPANFNLAQEILSNYRDKTILVVGHVNTVPALVQALGVGSLCPDYFPYSSGTCLIPDNEFDNLVTVYIPSTNRASLITVTKYGSPVSP